jgi:hypothetical protein
MKSLPNQMILPFLCWLLLTAMQARAQTVAPAILTKFALPLADQTIREAIFLPSPNGQAYLVYATSTGQLGLWTLTPTNPPPAPEPTPPTPPPPQKLLIAVVENPTTTTLEQRAVLAAPTWREIATEKHVFFGIIPNDVIEKGTGKPPASLVPFLDRAKEHTLPWCMFFTQRGEIVWEGQIPATAKELIDLIQRYGG